MNRFVTLIIVATLFLPTIANAQNPNRATEFKRFGFTLPVFAGARPAGMGGAYTSHGNDVHSLTYNPAGLARIKRFEISLGFHHDRLETGTNFFGTPSNIDTRSGAIEHVSGAFPIPTYRGSFVLAFGIYRAYSSNLDVFYTGANARENTTENYLLQQTGTLHSYNLGFGVDLSTTLSGGVSAFVIDGTISSLRQWDYTEPTPPQISEFLKDEVDVDIDGVGLRAGVQLWVHPAVSIGVSFTSPVLIRANGSGTSEKTEYIDNDRDNFEYQQAPISTNYSLPFQFEAGVTVHPVPDFLITAELGYSDWAEAAVERRRLRGSTTENGSAPTAIFREVISTRVGTEWNVPATTVRVRGGYARRPYPMTYIQTDRITDDRLQRAQDVMTRDQWTAGFGWLVGGIITVDAAFVYLRGERSANIYSEGEKLQKFLLTASYRL